MVAALLPWIADALVVAGLATISLGVYGLLRMPDLYTRLHAASKAVVLGVIPILLAAWTTAEVTSILRTILIGVFLLLTTPVAAHVIGWAAFHTHEPMVTPGAIDESGVEFQPSNTRPGPDGKP